MNFFSSLPLFARLAARNLRRNRRRSLLTASSVAFGLFCLLVFQALKLGLHQEMASGVRNLELGSVQIHAADYEANRALLQPIPQGREVLEALENGGYAFAPRIKAPALILSGRKSSTVLLTGVEPERERQVTRIADSLAEGLYLDEGGVLLGRNLAESLELGIGDRLTLMLQDAAGRPRTRSYPVTGTFETALSSFDRSRVYLRLEDARVLLGADGVLTEIALGAQEPAELLAARLQRELAARPLRIRTWKALSPDVTQMIELNDGTMNLLILIVFFIVTLGIANTMSMAVLERVRELGTLMALGTTGRQVLSLILLEALMLGAVSALLGSLAGWGACLYLGRYGIDLSAFTGENQYFAGSHVLRAVLEPPDLLRANLITLLTALTAALVPAARAVRLSPTRALRHI